MTLPQDEPEIDPFEAHFRRDPLPDAGILALILEESTSQPEEGEAVAESLRELLKLHPDRHAEVRIVRASDGPLCETLTAELKSASTPIILISTARGLWTSSHLEPLLKAIDQCDHVVGRRPLSDGRKLTAWLASLCRNVLFRVPIRDAYSPCRVHRREKLDEIILQSSSSFIDVEILAKATFLGHLIDEVEVSALPSWVRWKGWWKDLNLVFREPAFRSPLDEPGVEPGGGSGPAEPAEGQGEGHDRPGGEDRERHGDVEQPGPLEDDAPQGLDQLSQR